MSMEYVFKLAPGASLRYERKNPLYSNTVFADGQTTGERIINRLILEGDVLDSTRTALSGLLSLNNADEYDIEVTVKVTRKFEPGYFRRNLRHPHNHSVVQWFETEPWKQSIHNSESDWQRVSVAGV